MGEAAIRNLVKIVLAVMVGGFLLLSIVGCTGIDSFSFDLIILNPSPVDPPEPDPPEPDPPPCCTSRPEVFDLTMDLDLGMSQSDVLCIYGEPDDRVAIADAVMSFVYNLRTVVLVLEFDAAAHLSAIDATMIAAWFFGYPSREGSELADPFGLIDPTMTVAEAEVLFGAPLDVFDFGGGYMSSLYAYEDSSMFRILYRDATVLEFTLRWGGSS